MRLILCIFIKLIFTFLHFSKLLSKKMDFKDIDTIEYLINSKKSLIRWGDGETELLIGGNINFQNGSFSTMKSLLSVIKNYNKDSKYVLALPLYYLKMSDSQLKEINKFYFWYKIKYLYKLFLSKEAEYVDAFIFREESEISSSDIEKLWIDSKDIIFIHNNYKYYKDFSNKYKNSRCFFLEVTSCNSIYQSNDIIKKTKELITRENINKDNLKVLISSGPAAKVIIYNLSLEQLICYDMGHYFDYKFYNLKREWKDSQQEKNNFK